LLTCYYDSVSSMGYITLNPPTVDIEVPESENEIAKYMNPKKIIIPILQVQTLLLLWIK
jgi:hypothetical protein